jgi:hypothetical protein
VDGEIDVEFEYTDSMLKGIWCELRCEQERTTYAEMTRTGPNTVVFKNGPLEIKKGIYDLTIYENCEVLTDAIVDFELPVQKIELIIYGKKNGVFQASVKIAKEAR